jgi:Cu/Ag efflux pump CusA
VPLIISGIKALLPRVEESLPAGLNLHAVGDQSVFVKAAVFGVIREAALAAALVGLMILLFLGSWRSTLRTPSRMRRRMDKVELSVHFNLVPSACASARIESAVS